MHSLPSVFRVRRLLRGTRGAVLGLGVREMGVAYFCALVAGAWGAFFAIAKGARSWVDPIGSLTTALPSLGQGATSGGTLTFRPPGRGQAHLAASRVYETCGQVQPDATHKSTSVGAWGLRWYLDCNASCDHGATGLLRGREVSRGLGRRAGGHANAVVSTKGGAPWRT